jgi:hypothetical protein
MVCSALRSDHVGTELAENVRLGECGAALLGGSVESKPRRSHAKKVRPSCSF